MNPSHWDADCQISVSSVNLVLGLCTCMCGQIKSGVLLGVLGLCEKGFCTFQVFLAESPFLQFNRRNTSVVALICV